MRAAGRRQLVIPATAALVAALVLAHYLSAGWFFLDDFAYFGQARREGLTWHFLTSAVNQHFAPGHHLLDWLVTVPFGGSHAAAVVILLVFVAGAVIAMNALLDEALGMRPLHSALSFLFGLSAPVLITGFWFAGAAHALPALCFMVVSMWAFARWSRRGGRGMDLAVSGLATALALAFWVHAVLIPVLCAALCVCCVPEALTPSSTMLALRRHIRPLAIQACLVIAYLAYLSSRTYAPKVAAPDLSTTLHLLKVMLNHATFPYVVGNSIPNTGVGSWGRATQVLGALVFVSAFGWSLLTHRAAWRALGFFLVGFLGTAATIWAGRLAVVGPLIGNEPRYLTPLMLTIAVAAAIAAARPGRETSTRTLSARGTAAVRVAGVVGLAAYVAVFAHRANGDIFNRTQGQLAHAFVARLHSGVTSARSRGLGDAFVNVQLPNPIWYTSRGRDDQLSTLQDGIAPGISTLGAREPLEAVQGDGTVLQARFIPLPDSGGTRVLCRSRIECHLRVLPTHEDGSTPLYVRVAGLADAGNTTINIEPNDANSVKDDPSTSLAIPPGTPQVVVPAWSATVRSATVRFVPTSAIRVSVAVGPIEPTTG